MKQEENIINMVTVSVWYDLFILWLRKYHSAWKHMSQLITANRPQLGGQRVCKNFGLYMYTFKG